MSTLNPAPARAVRVSLDRPAIARIVGVVLLVVAPLGLGWLYVPGSAKVPATTLSFGDLHHLFASGAVPTNGVQNGYFGWLAWLLVALTVVTVTASTLTRHAAAVIAAAVVGTVGLLLTVFAFKGPGSWSTFIHQVPHLRIGGYFIILGFLAVLASSIATMRGRSDG